MILERPDSLGSFATLRGNQLSTGAWGSAPYGTPNTGYVWDAMLSLWVPMPGSAAGLVEAFSQLIAANTGNLVGIADSQDGKLDGVGNSLTSLLGLVNQRWARNDWPYLWASMLGAVQGLGFRKVLAVDAGAYTAVAAGATTISFTGVLLNGRTCGVVWNRTDGTLHKILTIVDPAGGAVGTITLETPIASAGAMLLIPYTDVPHAYNSAADALQTLAVVGDPPRINGPATFISVNAALAANFQYIIPCALYGRYQIDITWYTAGTTQVQFMIYGKYNDAAWAALGAIPAGYSQNSKFQTVAGIAFGAPPVGGGAAATPNILCARMQEPDGFNSFAIEMNSINRDAVAVVVTGTYRLQGGTT